MCSIVDSAESKFFLRMRCCTGSICAAWKIGVHRTGFANDRWPTWLWNLRHAGAARMAGLYFGLKSSPYFKNLVKIYIVHSGHSLDLPLFHSDPRLFVMLRWRFCWPLRTADPPRAASCSAWVWFTSAHGVTLQLVSSPRTQLYTSSPCLAAAQRITLFEPYVYYI